MQRIVGHCLALSGRRFSACKAHVNGHVVDSCRSSDKQRRRFETSVTWEMNQRHFSNSILLNESCCNIGIIKHSLRVFSTSRFDLYCTCGRDLTRLVSVVVWLAAARVGALRLEVNAMNRIKQNRIERNGTEWN
jgi:hypothetical protein